MKKLFILPALIFLLLSACTEKNKEVKKQKYLLLYIDLSNSIDDSATTKIKSDMLNLISQDLGDSAIINLFVIDEKVNTPLICKIKLPTAQKDQLFFEKQVYQSKLNEAKEELTRSLEKAIDQQKNSENKLSEESCLLNTLAIAHSKFRSIDTTKYECSIYYFTDLIEQCEGRGTGTPRLYFASSTLRCNYDLLKREIITNYNPGFNLYQYTGERIYFIRFPEKAGLKYHVNRTEIDSLWMHALHKVGFDYEQIRYLDYMQ